MYLYFIPRLIKIERETIYIILSPGEIEEKDGNHFDDSPGGDITEGTFS